MSGVADLEGGGTLALTVAIQDSTLPGEDISHTVFIASFGAPDDIRWSTFLKLSEGDEGFIKVDDKRVTGETTFDDEMTGAREEEVGTLEGTCP